MVNLIEKTLKQSLHCTGKTLFFKSFPQAVKVDHILICKPIEYSEMWTKIRMSFLV